MANGINQDITVPLATTLLATNNNNIILNRISVPPGYLYNYTHTHTYVYTYIHITITRITSAGTNIIPQLSLLKCTYDSLLMLLYKSSGNAPTSTSSLASEYFSHVVLHTLYC